MRCFAGGFEFDPIGALVRVHDVKFGGFADNSKVVVWVVLGKVYRARLAVFFAHKANERDLNIEFCNALGTEFVECPHGCSSTFSVGCSAAVKAYIWDFTGEWVGGHAGAGI